MGEILKNSWVVGIVTGIVSGLLVFLITNGVMKRKSKEEYFEQVSKANLMVISSLKPYISEKGLPELTLFKSIIASVARTFNVDVGDMYTVKVYCEELIREIVSDVYVSADKKEEYGNNLINYIKENDDAQKVEKEHKAKESSSAFNAFRRRSSLYVSIMTMLSISAITVTMMFRDNSFWYPFEDDPMLWLPISLILLTVAVAYSSFIFSDVLNKKRRKAKDKALEEKDSNEKNERKKEEE